MGSFNGFLVAFCRIPAIIVTLGTMALYRTLLVEYSDAQTVLTVNLPKWLLDLPRVNVLSYERLNLRLNSLCQWLRSLVHLRQSPKTVGLL